MKVLIVGAGGYIGSCMTEDFLNKGVKVIALDRFYFGETLADLKNNKNLKIIRADIRGFDKRILRNLDAVINLASISNDPSSELDRSATLSINYEGAVRLAKEAKKAGVKKYIFSSSCSVYGSGEEALTESSALNPLSIYAKSKIMAEEEILKLSDKNFSVTILRLATVYGISKRRMRFDLIINIMTLHAWKNKKIFIMGGGKQWRPLVHIQDVIRAFYMILREKDLKKTNQEIFNVGSNEQVLQVFELANRFNKFFKDLLIEKAPDDPDPRNYNVSFNKIERVFGFKPSKEIDEGITEIIEGLERGEINDGIKTNTLWYYQYLIEADNVLSKIKYKDKLF